MHDFDELIYRSTHFTLAKLDELRIEVIEELNTNASRIDVINLQMIQLQLVVISVGIFSIFEASLRSRYKPIDGFEELRIRLKCDGHKILEKRFSQFTAAINVLKHGRGRSYDSLLTEIGELPFRMKRPDQDFFAEGDLGEVNTLIEVDNVFVKNCVELIGKVTELIKK